MLAASSPVGAYVALCFFLLAGVGGPSEARPVKSLSELRSQNVVLQNWDLSCGAAALATLLRYQHDLDVTEREVALSLIRREEYLTNPDIVRLRQGFSLLDMKRYVDSRGFEGNGYGRLAFENLVTLAPIIVPVDLVGYPHFVVFRGIFGNRVLLADPSWGNRTVTVSRFERSWIAFPELGRVGFVVEPPAGGLKENRLAPRPEEFVMLR